VHHVLWQVLVVADAVRAGETVAPVWLLQTITRSSPL